MPRSNSLCRARPLRPGLLYDERADLDRQVARLSEGANHRLRQALRTTGGEGAGLAETTKERAASRRERKRALTKDSSSRWAGAITRTSEDAFQLAWRNLVAEQRSLRARTGRIRRRLAVPVARRRGRLRGYPQGGTQFR